MEFDLQLGSRNRILLPAPQTRYHTAAGPAAEDTGTTTVSSVCVFLLYRTKRVRVKVRVHKWGHLHWFVEETGSSAAVEKVVVLLHVAVGEFLGQVETVCGKHSDIVSDVS